MHSVKNSPHEEKEQAAPAERSVIFRPFRLDTANACLWRGTKRVALTPKDFAVLQYLVTHPGRLVRKEELLHAVWSDVVVSRGVLKVSIRRIRRTLKDKSMAPRFIETINRRGYWFIRPVRSPATVALALHGSRKLRADLGDFLPIRAGRS
jgi:DNA-binding winged helix-turn-helix (wHTH) protein